MVSWNAGFWSSPKGVWCCSSQGETEGNAVPPGGCEVCSAGGKGERLSQICSCPSTSSHHIVLLWHTGSGFLWSLPFPLILSHLLFLPAVSPLLCTTYIIIFVLWMMHLNKKKKNPPTYTTAAALLCPELQDTKQQGKKTDSSVSASRLLPAQAPLLAQSSVTAIHSTWVMGVQERWPACLRRDSSNRTFGNLLMATFGLLTDTISPAETHLGWLTAEWEE